MGGVALDGGEPGEDFRGCGGVEFDIFQGQQGAEKSAGLVKSDGVDDCKSFEEIGAVRDESEKAESGVARPDSKRDGEADAAWAGDDGDGESVEKGTGGTACHEPDDDGDERYHDDSGNEEPEDVLRNGFGGGIGGFPARGEEAVELAIRPKGSGAEVDGAIENAGSCECFIAGFHGAGKWFASVGKLLDEDGSAFDDTVRRDDFTGADFDQLTGGDF